MSIQSEASKHVATFYLKGDLDADAVGSLMNDFSRLVEDGITDFVFDLTEVPYVDSSALALFVGIDRKLRGRDGQFVLTGVQPPVRRIIEMIGILDVAPHLILDAPNKVADAATNRSGAMLSTHHFMVPSDFSALSDARNRVGEFMGEEGFPEEAVSDTKIALGEALSNAVRHGSNAAGSDIEVTVYSFADRIEIEIADHGVGYRGDIPLHGGPFAVSGRGIKLMHALANDVQFSTRPGYGTIVTIVMFRRPTA